MYENGKMKLLKTSLRVGEREIKENDGGGQ
jgi:hypothetical protein